MSYVPCLSAGHCKFHFPTQLDELYKRYHCCLDVVSSFDRAEVERGAGPAVLRDCPSKSMVVPTQGELLYKIS